MVAHNSMLGDANSFCTDYFEDATAHLDSENSDNS